MLPESC